MNQSLISDAPTHNATSAPELTTSAVLNRLCHCISRIPEFQCSGASVEQCAASETAADQAAPCTTRGCANSIVCQFCASQHSPSASLTQTIHQNSVLCCASQHSLSAALTVSHKPSDSLCHTPVMCLYFHPLLRSTPQSPNLLI